MEIILHYIKAKKKTKRKRKSETIAEIRQEDRTENSPQNRILETSIRHKKSEKGS